jgi:hypothetical protein
MSNRQIKFIWDFFGEDAHETAVHHAKHLTTFFNLNQVEFLKIDVAEEGDIKSVAYVISSEENVDIIKKSLRPHRAAIHEI